MDGLAHASADPVIRLHKSEGWRDFEGLRRWVCSIPMEAVVVPAVLTRNRTQ